MIGPNTTLILIIILSIVGTIYFLDRKFKKEIPYGDTGMAVVFGVVVGFTLSVFIFVPIKILFTKEDCTNYKIMEVGGCNSSGVCAIKLETGEYVKSRFPVKGGCYQICNTRWK